MSRSGKALQDIKTRLETSLGTDFEVKYWYPKANDKDPLERLAKNAALGRKPTIYISNMDSDFTYKTNSTGEYTRESVPLQNNYVNLIVFTNQKQYEINPFPLLDIEEKIEASLLGFTVSDIDVPLRFVNTVRQELAYSQNFWLMSTITTNWQKPLTGEIVEN